jgi:DNA-binding NtrC family response regulator
MHGSTKARVLHWFVRGGTARMPNGTAFEIDVDALVVGRDSGAQIVLDDPEVSATHCELRATDQGILVTDLSSTNGTFVGSTRVRAVVITAPTELTVGGTRLTIEPATKQRVDVGFADHFGPIVGATPKMRRVFSLLEKVSKTPLGVLLVGEAGTGKELAARAVHAASPRAKKPFIVVDFASMTPALAEGLIFGHEKGAGPAGADRRKGALADAHEGTLFLDELGELSFELQAKLMKALVDKHVKPLGASSPLPADVRVIAATRRDLGPFVNAGRFRSDLFFRVAQTRVEIPPLRERLDDLPLLIEDICAKVGKADKSATVTAWLECNFAAHDWPGNVRELSQLVVSAAALADTPGAMDDVLTFTRDADESTRGPTTEFGEAKRVAIASFERDYFAALFKRAKGNVSEMARQSGMERHHVRAYLRKCGIEK